MTIKPADAKSIGIIQQIAYTTWPVAYKEILSKPQLEYMLDKFYSTKALTNQMEAGQKFYLLDKNEQAIGFASFTHEGDEVYKLQKIYVLPDQQKTGAGKALMQHVENEVRKAGGKKLILNVNRANPAKDYYERNGFTIEKTVDIDIGGGYFMNDYVMGREIRAS